MRHIDDVELDHVAVCRPDQAANPDTYLATLAKAAEDVMDEALDEDAMLQRIGRAAVHAARTLWPFTKSEEAGQPAQRDDGAEIAALRDEVTEMLGDVREALDELRKATGEPDEPARPKRGVSQALPGQEKSGAADPWRGVV